MSAADFVGVARAVRRIVRRPGRSRARRCWRSRRTGGGYRVVTDQGTWRARRVVVATGPHGKPRVPPGLRRPRCSPRTDYRNPAQLAPGGVLVVGASASGVQIADELARAGREVVLAVGRHTRMPRTLPRHWTSSGGWRPPAGWPARSTTCPTRWRRAARRRCSWSGATTRGAATRTSTSAPCRHAGSGSPATSTRSTGRVDRASATTWPTRSGRRRRMHRFLDAVDQHVSSAGLTDEVWSPDRPRPVPVPPARPGSTCARERIGTVLLATGLPCPTTRGCGSRSPSRTARSGSAEGSRLPRGCTSSGSGSSTAGTRGSSTARGTTPATWSRTWWSGTRRARAARAGRRCAS